MLDMPGKALRRWRLLIWVLPKQTSRQELKEKQLISEMKEILEARGGNETGKAAKEGVLASKLAL